MGCCAQTNQKKDKKRQEPGRERLDTFQQASVTLRRRVIKKEPPRFDEIIYTKPKELLRWINQASRNNTDSHKKFINLIDKNGYREIHRIVGLDEVLEKQRDRGDPPFI